MVFLSKYLFVLSLIFPAAYRANCQPSIEKKIYNSVVRTEADTHLSSKQKLQILYGLKQYADNKSIVDSGYILLLVKLAKYEYLQNQNIPLAIYFTETALADNKKYNTDISKSIIVNALFNLGYYYEFSMRYNKALSYYDSVIELCKTYDPDDYRLLSRYYKAQIYVSLGDYQKATEESTFGIQEALRLKDFTTYASLLNFRAYTFFYQNDIKQTLANVDRCFQIAQQTKDQYSLATCYAIKGLIQQKEERYDSAEIFFKLAIITRPNLKENYETFATDYINLGSLYALNEKNFTKAKKNFYKSVWYAQKCNNAEKTQMLFSAWLNIGQLASKQHRYNDVVLNYSNALQSIHILTPNLLTYNVYNAQFNPVGYSNLVFSFLSRKTELLLQLFKETKDTTYLQQCLTTARITDTFIRQTSYQNLREGSKLYWRNESRSFFDNVIEACYLAHDINSAFYFIEKSRAVLLSEKWNQINATRHLPAGETKKQDSIELKIIDLQQQLFALSQGSVQYGKTENQLLQSRDDLQHFIASLEKKYPLYYQYKYADDALTLKQMQHYEAQNNQSFVYYFKNDSAIYVLGITKNQTSFIKVTCAEFAPSKLSEFISLCSDKQALMNNYKAFAILSQTIYQKLFQPLNIPKGNVAICTDNFFIPFEALCSDAKGKNYLLYNYNFSYVYSARSLLTSFTHGAPTGNFIGFAPVSFSPSLHVFDLKNSSDALQTVAGFYSNYTLFTQQNATRNNFINEASHYSVVTIFSHAHADTTDTEPVLYMQDSLVHLSDLQRLNNSSIQFVLLSACQTNIGKNATGEGIYSLARGFASVGVPSVSATLWNADEGAVYEISTKFNEYLAKGMNKSEALQKAKIWYLQTNSDNENSLPFFWANMVLIGSSEPIVLTSSNHWWVWISAIGCLLIIAAIFVFYKRRKGSF